jgi:hypothetical protein
MKYVVLAISTLMFGFSASFTHAATCYPPVSGDTNYDKNLATYNECVLEKNKSSCEAKTTSVKIYKWSESLGTCKSECVDRYYMTKDGDCLPHATESVKTENMVLPVAPSVTTAPVPVQTIYVPIKTEPKVITVIKEVPATTTTQEDATNTPTIDTTHPVTVNEPWWKKIFKFFGWI